MLLLWVLCIVLAVMESLARMLLPILKKYLDSDEGKRDWQEWHARRK